MDPKKDYYKILGVSERASQEEIKKAYRKLAKEYHPDTHAGDKKAEERFKEISEAHSILSDSKKRQQYDLMRRNPFASGQGNYGHSGFEDGGFRVRFGEEVGGGLGGIDDLLNSFFGFGRRSSASPGSPFEDIFQRPRTRRTKKGADLQAEVTVPFELAAMGGETIVQTPAGKRVKIKLPPGTNDGKRMKISGQGTASPGGGMAGDLYLTVHVAAHPKFDRRGNDIYSSKRINIAQAVLGTVLEVTTIDKKKVKLKIPPGTGSGKLFRLKGLGIPGPNGRSDHLVRIEISTPEKLSSQSRKTFEEWARREGLL